VLGAFDLECKDVSGGGEKEREACDIARTEGVDGLSASLSKVMRLSRALNCGSGEVIMFSSS
jgi:hypothetical protein